MTEFVSHWRCDECGESFSVTVEPVLLDEDGEPREPLPNADLVWTAPAPCLICNGPMRRTVSALDLRSFETIGQPT